MKNIHILPTENYSPLVHSTNKYGGYFKSAHYSPMKEMGDSYQHIYITSDEEITGFENNIWVIKGDRIFLWQNTMALVSNNKPKKIILTTDQDLIKDGVQPIDDDFLEWFVKNPSCEQVEVHELIFFNPDTNESAHCKWELIIPQKEDKQETHICKYCNAETTQSDDECYAKPKTLEETAERYAEGKSSSSVFQEAHKKDFIEGAKWQAERIENKSEQLINELESLVKDNNLNESYRAGITASIWRIKEWFELKEWFEQFKKK